MKPITACLLFALALLLPSLAPLAEGQSAKFTTLYSFSAFDGNRDNADGFSPGAGLALGKDGSLYGTAPNGGPYGKGTAFKATPGGAFTVLQRFGNNNGAIPYAPLLLASDGGFYGATYLGGHFNKGTVFKLTPSGQLTTLHHFTGQSTQDGAHPGLRLVEGKDSNFYGVTDGDMGYNGSVYQMTPAGVVTILHTFAEYFGGSLPVPSALTAGSDGNLYGTYLDTERTGQGYIYRVTPGGGFDKLYQYNGEVTYSALVEVTPGVFYTTSSDGNLFKFTADEQLSEVPVSNASGPVGALGFGAEPLLASDGNLYGVGGTITQQLLYSIKLDGSNFTILYKGYTGSNGDHFASPLVQGRNGSFYGVTSNVGTNGNGTIFNLAVPPTLTSPANASGKVGQPFSYQITASLAPTHFGALGLFSGLKVDAKTGIISGTPTAAGTKTLTLQATNTGGTGTGSLKLTITN